MSGRELPQLRIYASEHAHSSVDKAAYALGFGARGITKIASDPSARMDIEALGDAVSRDLADGVRPCAVVATLGTTSTASVDPLPAIVKIARDAGMWVHVDSAYAGPATIAPEFRWLWNGIEGADSIVVNPHKWLFTPLDLSVLYTRRPDVLRQAFSLVPEYLRSRENPRAVNFMEYGIPLGRRFRALKLWFILRYYGRDGLAAMIRAQVGWMAELAAQVEAHPDFELCAPAPLSVVCLRHRSDDETNRHILESINAGGEIFLSHTMLAGRYVIRVAIGNQNTTRDHVQRAWQLILNASSR
jgi:aromatic-L-amino-acid decarboxylase